MDAEALFLDQEVRRGERDLQAGGERDRAERAVRGQHRAVRLGERGDPAHLGDAAGVRQVGLDDRDARLQRGEEVRRGRRAARRWRSGSVEAATSAGSRCAVLGQHRLLDEQRLQRLELRQDAAARRRR